MDRIRGALLTEIPALNALIEASATELSRGYYTPAQVRSLIVHVFGEKYFSNSSAR